MLTILSSVIIVSSVIIFDKNVIITIIYYKITIWKHELWLVKSRVSITVWKT